MPRFMYVFRGTHVLKERSREEYGETMDGWRAWADSFRDRGAMFGGSPLEVQGRVVGGDGLVTDGPFAEGKELVGGFFLVECKNLDEATDLARQCPGLGEPGVTVEVRPCLE